MEVILLERVQNLGKLGDKVKVRAGYGRNYLIPKGKAVMATTDNIASFEARRAELEKKAADEVAAARARADKLAELGRVTLVGKAGDEGKLFGSIGAADVADALGAAGVEVDKREVRMPEGGIRHVGEFEVVIHLHTDVEQPITIEVAAE